MKVFKWVLGLMLVAGLSACGPQAHTIDFEDPNSGQTVDRATIVTDASNPMAPSSTMVFNYNPQTGEVEIVAYAAGATPVEQLVPLGEAGVTASGMISAAKATKPAVTNINNTNVAEGGQGGVAIAEGGDATAINWNEIEQSVDVNQWTQIKNCQAGVRHGGKKVWFPGCGGY